MFKNTFCRIIIIVNKNSHEVTVCKITNVEIKEPNESAAAKFKKEDKIQELERAKSVTKIFEKKAVTIKNVANTSNYLKVYTDLFSGQIQEKCKKNKTQCYSFLSKQKENDEKLRKQVTDSSESWL